MKAVTAEQMREIEQQAVEAGISLDQLMENAGLAVANAIAERADHIYGKTITVLVGPGNNGSDGLVAARHLAKRGANVRAFALTKRPDPDEKRIMAEEAGVEFFSLLEDGSAEEQYRSALANSSTIIDAVLGTGQSRAIEQPLARYLEVTRSNTNQVVAIDVPTGINSDTGEFDPNGLPAELTLMLGYPKVGPLVLAGEGNCGEIQVLDIGIPDGSDSNVSAEYLTEELAREILPPRPNNSNKGTFGRTLIAGGSINYIGAPLLSTHAALRSGAGLVFLATPENVYRLIAGKIDEAIYIPLDAPEGTLNSNKAASQIVDQAAEISSVLTGPGLGQSPATVQFVEALVRNLPAEPPVVLDADALNIVSRMHDRHEQLKPPAVLTPHPGEMARLLGKSVAEIQANRSAAALEAAERFHATVVLKGAATLIAEPNGRLRISPWVNSGLAKGGTGDVLAGLLAGLLAQAPDMPFDMASLAVYLHGLAGDLARQRSGERGMTAGDVAAALPGAFLDLEATGIA